MFAYAGLQPASFRGVGFLCPHDSNAEGPNVVKHHFPASTSHFMEPNGVYQGEFKLKCVLDGPNLLGRFSALRSALNVQAPGTLKHPWLGPKICIPEKWHVTRDDRDIGVLEIEVTFLETGPPKFPGIVGGIASTISGLSATAITLSFANLTASFALPTAPYSAAYVSGIMSGLANTVQSRFPQVADVAVAARAVRDAQ